MSVRHSNPSQPQSLPPFAVAFSNSSLDRLSSHPTSLPPIQPRPIAERPRSLPETSQSPAMLESTSLPNGRKRSHPDAPQHDDTASDNRATNSTSPHLGRVKTEHDEPADDSHSQTRQLRSHPAPPRQDPDSRSIPPSASSSPSQPSPKKRRMTIGGSSNPVDQTSPNTTASDNKTSPPPIIVAGPPMERDDPSSVEQVRSIPTVKRTQEAPVEKRRGSLGGSLPATTQIAASPAAAKPPPGSSRVTARSPNLGVARTTRAADAPSDSSPAPPPGQSQQTDLSAHPPPPHHNSLPPPPISFAGRRTIRSPSQQKKPADIVISPRDVRTQPVIQSAPPRQGRFPPMALPSLPKVHQPPGSRRIPGNVPPTPTRLTLRSSLAASSSTSSLTVPPPASVPISTILVPQTPAVFSRTDSASQRNAFLAPFEALYDTLREVKESKTWLAEQFAKVQALQTGFDAAVDAAVERRVGGLREEIARLQRRVEELECSRGTEAGPVMWRRRSVTNGDVAMLAANAESMPMRETYTFPPVHPRATEGTAGDDSDMRETESPAPAFDVRRQSISAVRMDPPPLQPSQQQTDAQGSSAVKSPPSSGGGGARRPGYQSQQPPPQQATSQPGSPVGAS
ncbi:hypothetical protein BC827DRAFT_1151769 [Russula dissimulans]|nr:hypothetical protein BC827DRAFT_1151769 [Russula dissimulans]